MSLNTIRLSLHHIADLYPESLVLTADTVRQAEAVQQQEPPAIAEKLETTKTHPDKPIEYLGTNNRNLIILVAYPDTVHIADTALEFLSSVLKACQLTVADVAIVNLARQNPGMEQLRKELVPKLVLSFGQIPPVAGFPQEIPVLTPQLVQGIFYMAGPALEELNQQTEAIKPLKRQLWEGLKTMLGIAS
jgi:hypothetical protein